MANLLDLYVKVTNVLVQARNNQLTNEQAAKMLNEIEEAFNELGVVERREPKTWTAVMVRNAVSNVNSIHNSRSTPQNDEFEESYESDYDSSY